MVAHTSLDQVISVLRRENSAAADACPLLGLHPLPRFTIGAAAALLGVSWARTAPLLNALEAAGLLTEEGASRAMTRDAHVRAGELAERLHMVVRHAAVCRMLDHYRSCAAAASARLDPRRDVPGGARPRRPDPFPDDHAALAWLAAEESNLLAAVSTAASRELHLVVYQLIAACWPLHTRQARPARWTGAGVMLARAADRCGDWAVLRHAEHVRAVILGNAGQTKAAITHAHAALALARGAQQATVEVEVLFLLSQLHEHLGETQAADGFAARAAHTTRSTPLEESMPDENVHQPNPVAERIVAPAADEPLAHEAGPGDGGRDHEPDAYPAHLILRQVMNSPDGPWDEVYP